VIIFVLMIAFFFASALATEVTGDWRGQIVLPSGVKHDLKFHLQVAGNKITGAVTGGPPTGEEQTITNGRIDGEQVSFKIDRTAPGRTEIELTYTGKIAGDQIQGWVASPFGNLPFTVSRK
jgi:hypothetical protein